MQPQIAKTEPTETCRPAQLRLVIDGHGDLDLIETQSGAHLLGFREDKVVAYTSAELVLHGHDVDTAFADWDGNGCMVVEPLP